MWIGTVYGIALVTVGGWALSVCHVGKRAEEMIEDDEDGGGGGSEDESRYPIAKDVINVNDYRSGRVDSHGAIVWAGENDVRVLH